MLSLVKKNAAFFIPYFLFLLCGGVVLICFKKTDITVFINTLHSPTADTFFKYYTNIGLGWLILPVVFVLSFMRLRYVIMAVATFLLAVIVNDTIKFAVGAPRPAEVFSQLHQSLYFIPGEEIDHWNSFPSGHTVTAFSSFSLLALVYSKNSVKFLLFVMAFLVAYSRMYLAEHFLVDVYVASLIGVCSSIFVYLTFINMPWLNKFKIIDKPLIPLRKAS
jgi:membrane-associated phospholipid phosphatase